ncbi:hypothetical protein [Mucilaginibacter sp. RCC_168]|uniref:hypothetical protein n=1 Tax=unclassified Mucilaginibacter TaxID=2617802 RepID=UPI003526414A
MKKSIRLLPVAILLTLSLAACKGHNSSTEKDSTSTSMGAKNGGGASGVPDSTSSNMSTDTGRQDSAKKDKGIVP